MQKAGPIGIFDSGFGGLTVMREIVKQLPQYDYIYLGDNARSPYGPRSYETVYKYTQECVNWFFEQGCSLVILACNTASAKALRTIQQNDLPKLAPGKRVLGVIRPTTEVIGNFSETKNVGILATTGTVNSGSYLIEISKFFPEVKIFQEACPMWVPLVENNEYKNHGANYFVKKHIDNLFDAGEKIDVVLLACTHYPLLKEKIQEFLPIGVKLITQGEIVAHKLVDYLERHPEIDRYCSKNGHQRFFTTDDTDNFNSHASVFFGEEILSIHVSI